MKYPAFPKRGTFCFEVCITALWSKNLTKTIPRLIIQRDHLRRKEPRKMESKLPAPLPKGVKKLHQWYTSRPKGSWLVVLESAEIMGEVVVQDSSGNVVDRIKFPEGYGVTHLPWVFGSEADYTLVGDREALSRVLEAYNSLYDAWVNFFETLESLEE